MSIFIPIYKVDEEQRMVYGRAADETPDLSGEVWDYAANKPLVQAWSEAAKERSGGKSLGNIRGQHKMTDAAGVVKSLEFDDEAKSLELGVKVVDDSDWAKVQEGVYTGFSVGGRYISKKADIANPKLQRVVIKPSEFSLVDSPCNPNATYTAVKLDGSEEERSFKTAKREDVSPKEGVNQYGDVEFADEKNKKYPIDTPAHIRAAWNYIHKKKNRDEYSASDAAAIEKRIEAVWRKKIDPKGPPSAAKKTADSTARKGMYTVGNLAAVLDTLSYMHSAVINEREAEGDESDLPERLGKAIEALSDVFLEMADEETKELLSGIKP